MNLEHQLVNDMGKQISNEIDFHVLSEMLVDLGWKKVTLTRFFSRKHSVNILMWCQEHVKHPFEHRGTIFIFENEGDAVNFALKWL